MRVWRSVRDEVRARAPGAYGQARNALWVSRWYVRRLRGGSLGPARDPYDAAFWDQNEQGDWDGFARLVLDLFRPRSVLDVGCGSGALLRAIGRAAPVVRRLGLEHSPEALRRARSHGVEARPFDAMALDGSSARRLRHELGDWDLVTCFEVAEHLPPWRARPFVRFLAQWDTLVFSAARPGQGGVWHLNEQHPRYWLKRFAACGMANDSKGGTLRQGLAPLNLGPWYAANTLVLSRRPLAPVSRATE
ncbi:MAG TPA: class I SAM-dependent methyltransferase [Vicinamibacterales bacterium]|nr:class I SAM-dependent methyltransferase [Vicinamibacterales bacterium]